MPKIAIVGAGINGLAFAISLRQLGFKAEDITIYEKAEAARAEGTGIIFWAEAVNILKRIGVDLTKSGVCLPHISSIFLREGQEPLIVDIEKKPHEAAYGFLREKIYQPLLTKAQEYDLHIQTGFECVHVEQDDKGCELRFKNGKSITADVVIGCDGIYSSIRQQILPSVQPIALNIKAVRGIYTCDEAERKRLQLPLDACQINCGSQFRVLLYPNFNDRDKGLTSYYWFAAHRIEPTDVAHESIEKMITQLPLCPENLKTVFRDTPDSHIIHSATLRQLPFFDSTRGRIALLGDSAHAMAPTAGLGVLLGIINALYLAGHLALNRDDISSALKQYSASVAEHSKACLDYNSRLTDLFYVANPLSTAGDAKSVYAPLYSLTALSAGKAVEFYDSAMKMLEKSQVYLASKSTATLTADPVEDSERKTKNQYRNSL